jgi:hypothetical protein
MVDPNHVETAVQRVPGRAFVRIEQRECRARRANRQRDIGIPKPNDRAIAFEALARRPSVMD